MLFLIKTHRGYLELLFFFLKPSWGTQGWAYEVATHYCCPVPYLSPVGLSLLADKGHATEDAGQWGAVSVSPSPIPMQTSILRKSTFLL